MLIRFIKAGISENGPDTILQHRALSSLSHKAKSMLALRTDSVKTFQGVLGLEWDCVW